MSLSIMQNENGFVSKNSTKRNKLSSRGIILIKNILSMKTQNTLNSQ